MILIRGFYGPWISGNSYYVSFQQDREDFIFRGCTCITHGVVHSLRVSRPHYHYINILAISNTGRDNCFQCVLFKTPNTFSPSCPMLESYTKSCKDHKCINGRLEDATIETGCSCILYVYLSFDTYTHARACSCVRLCVLHSCVCVRECEWFSAKTLLETI